MSKLADIEATLIEYQTARAAVDNTPESKARYQKALWNFDIGKEQWLTDLIAIAQAAQAMRAVRHDLIIDPSAALNNPQLETRLGNSTRAMHE